jgi:7-cyano-7-deazaguanine synthase in queuosine biosynthesis
MTALLYVASESDLHIVDAILPDELGRAGATLARIDEHLCLSMEGLEAYFFAKWEPVLVDLMIVAAAIEFCDVTCARPSLGWARSFDVRIAVHDQRMWEIPHVKAALSNAASFLTGDAWAFSFINRARPLEPVRQQSLDLGSFTRIIMPYSDGLDSRAVAALLSATEGRLMRVRLGTKGVDQHERKTIPFMTVPYEVRVEKGQRRESSSRSRGFKFAVITGIAAHLAGVKRVVVSESGQGALGPILTVTGHSYPDYRVHPAFTRRMEQLFEALLGQAPEYEFPRLWSTKGETLAEAAALPNPVDWTHTRSCWQQSRQVAVDGKRRQCGICAACLLRRMSLHRASLADPPDTYVWTDLSAPTIREGAADGFTLFTNALDEYAIAGVLHLDHLAGLAASPLHARLRRRVASEIALARGESIGEELKNLESLLQRHKIEWTNFVASLGNSSFVAKLAAAAR